MSQVYWRMKTGKVVKISEMTTKHIINSIKLFQGTGSREEEVEALILELEYRKGIGIAGKNLKVEEIE